MQIRKKTYLLPQKLISEVKRTCGAKTETEAIIRAMEEFAFNKQVIRWHQKNSARMRIRNLYG